MTFKHWILSIISPAKYKMGDKILYIKQAFHDWENIENHVNREHPELLKDDIKQKETI